MSKPLPSLTHPVLDQSPALRARAYAHRLWCKDQSFRGWQISHRFVCEHGHEFDATPSSIVRAFRACPVCSDEQMYTQLCARAAALDIVCLDDGWKGRAHAYRFRCSQGHEWRHRPVSIACPQCGFASPNKRESTEATIANLHRIAKVRGGQCLSEVWLGRRARYRMRCAAGHEWEPLAHNVLIGTWCPSCARNARRVDLSAACELAQLLRGQCLSSKCPSGTAELFWRCARGHVWGASLLEVRNGRWCQECEVIEARESGLLSLNQLQHE